jgi:opacity protein-like surface antigen
MSAGLCFRLAKTDYKRWPTTGRFLPYVLGGVATTQLKAIKQLTGAGSLGTQLLTGPWGGAASHVGAALGVGAQYAVLPGLSVGLDYLYTVYGAQDHSGAGQWTRIDNMNTTSSSVGVFQSSQSLTTHTSRFIVNYKFD